MSRYKSGEHNRTQVGFIPESYDDKIAQEQLYHQLGLHRICKEISNNYKFTFNLDSILSRLIYGRILFPSSKLNTYQESKSLLEQPDFELQHIYRALEVIAKETDFIIFKDTKK